MLKTQLPSCPEAAWSYSVGVGVELLDHRDQRGGASTFSQPCARAAETGNTRDGVGSGAAEVWDDKPFHNGALLSACLLLCLT